MIKDSFCCSNCFNNAYPYPFNSEYYFDNLPILEEFTDMFRIDSIKHVDGKLNIIKTRKI